MCGLGFGSWVYSNMEPGNQSDCWIKEYATSFRIFFSYGEGEEGGGEVRDGVGGWEGYGK